MNRQLNPDCLKNDNDMKGTNRILIKDSVCFQVDPLLSDIYPGRKGTVSEACVRIQFEYNLLNGWINDLSLSAYTHQDARDSIDTIENIRDGDLIIRDLAYMEIKVLRALIKKAAFLLCRLKPKVVVYTRNKKGDDYQMVNFLSITRHLRRKNSGR